MLWVMQGEHMNSTSNRRTNAAGGGRLRDRALEAALVAVSVILCVLCIEVGYRVYLFYTFAVQANYPVQVVDGPQPSINFGYPGNVFGPMPIAAHYNAFYYDGQDRLIYEHKVLTNNLGWTSRYNYSVAKASGEYRIAVVGGSTTAADDNELAWTDVTQDRLNGDTQLLSALGVERISVLSIGVAGASVSFLANPTAIIAARFSPDMVVANLSIENALAGGSSEFVAPTDVRELLSIAPLQSPPELRLPFVVIDNVTIPLYCSRGDQVVSNPDCMVSPIWYVSPGTRLSSADLAKVKVSIARRRLLYTVLLSFRPLALLRALGHAAIPQAGAATLTDPQHHAFTVALKALQFVRQLQPNMLITHNPHIWHLKPDNSALVDELIRQIGSDGFDIVRMSDHMPAGLETKEAANWYMFNGHWNDHGAEVYGEAIYRVLRERLLARTREDSASRK
jgi:hypothetical protein